MQSFVTPHQNKHELYSRWHLNYHTRITHMKVQSRNVNIIFFFNVFGNCFKIFNCLFGSLSLPLSLLYFRLHIPNTLSYCYFNYMCGYYLNTLTENSIKWKDLVDVWPHMNETYKISNKTIKRQTFLRNSLFLISLRLERLLTITITHSVIFLTANTANTILNFAIEWNHQAKSNSTTIIHKISSLIYF